MPNTSYRGNGNDNGRNGRSGGDRDLQRDGDGGSDDRGRREGTGDQDDARYATSGTRMSLLDRICTEQCADDGVGGGGWQAYIEAQYDVVGVIDG